MPRIPTDAIETFQSVDVTRAARGSSRAGYFYSYGVFNPFLFPRVAAKFTCFNYNKPFNPAYKRGTGRGSVGTISSSSSSMRNRI